MNDGLLLPLILLIDMDGTIIGDTTLQVCRHEISLETNIKVNIDFLKDELASGLLRPYFESFIKMMKSKYDNIEIYIYTAADLQWAKYLISVIEKTIDIKFNRPIFSRNYCYADKGSLKKSVVKVLPVIYKNIKSKYHLQNITLLNKQVVMIDNNYVYHELEMQKFVKCPTYDYFAPCDMLSFVNNGILQKHFNNIMTIFAKYKLLKVQNDDVLKMRQDYYNVLSLLYKNGGLSVNRVKLETDKFWLIMERLFTNYKFKSFNRKVVSYINTNVTKTIMNE